LEKLIKHIQFSNYSEYLSSLDQKIPMAKIAQLS